MMTHKKNDVSDISLRNLRFFAGGFVSFSGSTSGARARANKKNISLLLAGR